MISGYCYAHGRILAAGLPWTKLRIPAISAVLISENGDITLIDTGYSSRFLDITQHFPEKLYAWVTPVEIAQQDSVKEQLKRLGYGSEKVKNIIVTHFHGDHTGGLLDFPMARFYCSERAWYFAKSLTGFQAVKNAILKAQIPQDFEERAVLIPDSEFTISLKDVEPLHSFAAIFEDHKLYGIKLEGHAVGQMGVLVELQDKRRILMVADACWLSRSFQQNAFPSALTKLFVADYACMTQNISWLYALHQKHSDIYIVPFHCQEAIRDFQKI